MTVDKADATAWLEGQLARMPAGQATVVFHSFVLQYLDDKERSSFERLLWSAGRRATNDAPLAWLSLEWCPRGATAQLTHWPGGESRLIARTHGHDWGHEWLG